MAADIALQFRPARFDSPVNQLAQVLQIRGMQDEQSMNQLKMDEYRRGVADQEAMRAALSQPDADPYKVLLQRGNVKGAMDWQKGQLEAQKAQREAAKADLEMGLKKAEHVGSILSLAKDPQSYSQVRQVIAQNYGKQLPEQFDPMFVQATIAEGQTLTQRLAAEYQRMQLAETGRHNVATEQNAAGQLRVAQGNLGMRQQELQHAQNQPRGQIVETDQGFMLADPRAGTARPVMGADGRPLQGKAANRQLTDAQGKANLFGSRMAESHRILNDLEGKYSPMAVNAKMAAADMPGVGGAAGYVGNLMLSSEGQQAEQAQRDFINAVLRRESGAVISAPEFANGQKQYFPQPGDSPAVLAQKRRNRELAIQGMAAEVPGGLRSAPSLTSAGQNGGATGGWGNAPAAGAVQDGYRFKGGNPADPKSWEKI